VTLEVLISREARADIAEAAGSLGEISPSLPERFAAELERIYAAIGEYPQMYPVVYKNFRRALLRRFPYSVFYITEPSLALVIGVVHQARDESTWKRRA
jgi:plasmid stabilization system protein ParE